MSEHHQTEIPDVSVKELRAAVAVLRCDHTFSVFSAENVRPCCQTCGIPYERHDAVAGDIAVPLASLLAEVAHEAEKHAAKGWGNQADEIAGGWPLEVARAITEGAQ